MYDKDGQELEDRYKEATNKSPYEEIDFWSQIAKLAEGWMTGRSVIVTPGGYAFLNQWGSARYNTATQFAALVYDKHNHGGPSTYSEWARGQMNYLMGDNPLGLSYIVGYNENSVKFLTTGQHPDFQDVKIQIHTDLFCMVHWLVDQVQMTNI